MSADYPPHWQADVVLADGGTAHLRPIRAEDATELVALHARLSPQTIRYRYFAARPRLSPDEVQRLTQVDYDNRLALVAVLGEHLVAVARYDRLPGSDVAEVAFVVDDAHHGRGLASVLLEHLASIAAERGIGRFEADVLADNPRMVRVFLDAGYQASRSYEEDVIHLVFPIEPTAVSLAVMQQREHQAEARSIGRLLNPRSVAVVGASRRPGGIGHVVLVNLLRSGFQGPVYPVNPHAGHVAGVRAYPSVADVPDDIDLAVLAIPASSVPQVIAACAHKGVCGLVVLSGGFSETGQAGLATEQALVATARANGMRVIGANCLGVMNTALNIRLNATLAPALPRGGRAGIFCESGALGVAILELADQRGLGLSAFVSAGNRADVSANDMLQYWEDDPATDVVLLHLESGGNPRKFARLARRVGRRKPIVAVTSGAIAARLAQMAAPKSAAEALVRQVGVIPVDTLAQLFDVAQVLTTQPLPAGPRVAIVGNSGTLGRLAADACAGNGLEVGPLSPATRESLRAGLEAEVVIGNPLTLTRDSGSAEFNRALATVLADPVIDAVVSVFVPPLDEPDTEVAKALSAVSKDSTKPLVTALLGFGRFPAASRECPGAASAPGAVRSFPSPEVAVAALARVAAYAQWRRRPEGTVPILGGVDRDGARALITDALRESAGGPLPADRVERLLGMYGVQVLRTVVVTSVDEAVAAAAQVGYPVALKATAGHLRHRPELGTVRLGIASKAELRAVYQALAARLDVTEAGLAVQAMAPPGVATVIRTAEDPSFGAVVSFGLSGVATDLLGDRAFRIVPLTDVDAAELVRAVRAAPLLFGYRGREPVDVAALEQLLLRVARLADDLPEVAELVVDPVIVASEGVCVLRATARVAVPSARLDTGPRRLH